MKVLIIEGHRADALQVEKCLREGSGPAPEIFIAEDLEEAITLLETEHCDVSLINSNLPGAVEKISEIASSLPIVILSGDDGEGEEPQDYLHKSELNGRAIRRALRYAIERKALEETLSEMSRDLASARRKLIHAAKMELTGRLAVGVAHEVKNPLSVIQLGIESLLTYIQPARDRDPRETKIIDRIQSAVDRANHVVGELLDFSSDHTFNRETADINETVARALDLIKPQLLKAKINYQVSFSENIPLANIDRRKIEQSIINLVMNAENAMEHQDDKRIRLSTRAVYGIEPEENFITISVADSGPGIDPAKSPDNGNGLWLSVVQNITLKHSGTLQLKRSKMGGLLVEMSLPMAPIQERGALRGVLRSR